MSALVAFINARLDEDEAIAQAASYRGDHRWELYPNPDRNGSEIVSYVEGSYMPFGTVVYAVLEPYASHLAHHDPARVLREVSAKRGVVREMEAARKDISGRGINVPFFITWTLMHLAKVYADHPDYKRDWHID